MRRLSELRGNLSQFQMAQKLGLARQTYRNYELGTREPPFKVLIAMANYFNVSVDYLIGNDSALSPDATTNRVFIDDAEERELIRLYRSITREAKDAIIANARTAKLLYPKKDN